MRTFLIMAMMAVVSHAATNYRILQINDSTATLRANLNNNQIAITADSVAGKYNALVYTDGSGNFYITLADSHNAYIPVLTGDSVNTSYGNIPTVTLTSLNPTGTRINIGTTAQETLFIPNTRFQINDTGFVNGEEVIECNMVMGSGASGNIYSAFFNAQNTSGEAVNNMGGILIQVNDTQDSTGEVIGIGASAIGGKTNTYVIKGNCTGLGAQATGYGFYCNGSDTGVYLDDGDIVLDKGNIYVDDGSITAEKIVSDSLENSSGSGLGVLYITSGTTDFNTFNIDNVGDLQIQGSINNTGAQDFDMNFGSINNIALVQTQQLELPSGGIVIDNIYDTDSLTENSATALATQRSIRASIDSATIGFLPLAGGTMTGGLTMSTGTSIFGLGTSSITMPTVNGLRSSAGSIVTPVNCENNSTTTGAIARLKVDAGNTETYLFSGHTATTAYPAKAGIFGDYDKFIVGNDSSSYVVVDSGGITKARKSVYDTTVINGNLIYEPPHAFFGFEDSIVVISATLNNWEHVTNNNNDLWAVVDTHAITIANDTIIINEAGSYSFSVNVSFSGNNGETWKMRIFNSSTCGFNSQRYTGNNDTGNMSLIAYCKDATVGERFVLQLQNISDDDDPTIKSGAILIHKIH